MSRAAREHRAQRRRRTPGRNFELHLMIADPTVPADHLDRHRCTTCGRMRKAGDANHIDPEAPPVAPRPPRPLNPELAEQARLRDAAILGEKEDDE